MVFKTEKDMKLKIEVPVICTNDWIDGIVDKTSDDILEHMPPSPDEGNIDCFCLLLADMLKKKTGNNVLSIIN